jgi:hypothetical protein
LSEYGPARENGSCDIGRSYTRFNAVTNCNTTVASNHCHFNTLVAPQYTAYQSGLAPAKNDYCNQYMQKKSVLNSGRTKYNVDSNTIQVQNATEILSAPNTHDTGFTRSMWAPNGLKFNMDGHGQPSAPQWMYIGLQDIQSVPATT